MLPAASAVSPADPERPLLRGVLHLAAAAAAVAGAVLLILLADSARGYVGAAIFAASLILLYLTSGIYHSITWQPAVRALLRRLDHSMIFVLIAGTYTPFCLLILNDAWGITMLSVVWGISGAGVLMHLLWPGVPRWLLVAVYVTVGWTALVAAAPLSAWLTAVPLALLVLGGILYTVGGLVYAAKRPDPFPRIFGYHEVFHAFVVAGSTVHFSVVAAFILPA